MFPIGEPFLDPIKPCVARHRREASLVCADTIVAADSPRSLSSAGLSRGACQRDRGIMAQPIGNERFCLPECPAIEGFRGPCITSVLIPVPRAAKPVFTVVLSYPRPNGEPPRGASLPGTAALAGRSAPLSANGHVVEDAYKPDASPIQAKFAHARWRANAPSPARKHCGFGRKRTILCTTAYEPCSALLHLPSQRLGFAALEGM